MAEIPKKLGEGGAHLSIGHGAPDLKTIMFEVQEDLAALRAAIVAITAKLDAENVTNLDTDYAAICDPAALKTTKQA
jgi:hypothetical protein